MPRAKPELDVRPGRSVVYTRNVDLVFVTNYRRPVFTDPMLIFSEHLIREVCGDLGAKLSAPSSNSSNSRTDPTKPGPPRVPANGIGFLPAVTGQAYAEEWPVNWCGSVS